MQKYLAEFLGTFFLAGAVVLISTTILGASGYGVVFAAVILGLIVYTLGPISGAHVNPALTVGQMATKRITGSHALWYVAAQAVAALVVFGLVQFLPMFEALRAQVAAPITDTWYVFIAEVIGSAIFAFSVAAVAFGKVDRAASGLVVGGGLLLGSIIAQMLGAQGILNPAVAYATNALSSAQGIIVYGLGPIVGAKIAMMLYGFLTQDLNWAMYKNMFAKKNQ